MRWAETTWVSNGTPMRSSVAAVCWRVSQSDWEPMMTPTSGWAGVFIARFYRPSGADSNSARRARNRARCASGGAGRSAARLRSCCDSRSSWRSRVRSASGRSATSASRAASPSAIANAYDVVASVAFRGMHYRKDIGHRALARG